MNVTINIDMDKKCAECRKGGAAQNGICLQCMTKAIGHKPMKSSQGQAVQRAMLGAVAKAKSVR
jgi:hypothetical protein